MNYKLHRRTISEIQKTSIVATYPHIIPHYMQF